VYPIELAFTFKGVDYFTYTNMYSLPHERSFMAISVYEEFNMRMTKDVLENYLDAQDAIINSNTVKLTDIVLLNQQLRDRLHWVIEPETILKLASVVYFTKEEDPTTYDIAYNLNKINGWKNHKSTMLSFFLQVPLQELCPLLTQRPEVIQSCLQGVVTKSILQMKTLKDLLGDSCSSDTKTYLQSKIVELQELTTLI